MVTYYMGMMPLEHEYKVMGLAPYVGDPGKAKKLVFSRSSSSLILKILWCGGAERRTAHV